MEDDDYDSQEEGDVYDDNQNRRELGQEEKEQQRELEMDEGADANQSRWTSTWNRDHQEVREDEYDNEEEEMELQSLVKRTIKVGNKQIPMGSTPRPESKRKICFKFTTRRLREEELAQIKGEIAAKQDRKSVV